MEKGIKGRRVHSSFASYGIRQDWQPAALGIFLFKTIIGA